MPCMCGDLYCPSCGPAQGANPEFESVCEWIAGKLLVDMPACLNADWLCEELANRLGQCSQETVDAITAEAKSWEREEYRKRREARRCAE